MVASGVPARRADRPETSAVNVVVSEMTRALRELGHGVTLQLIFNVHRSTERLTAADHADLDDHEALGIRVLPPLFPSAFIDARVPSFGARLRRLLRLAIHRPELEAVYPAVRLRAAVKERIGAAGADVALTIWSPEGVAACQDGGVPLVAYHGDIDFEPGLCRYRDRELFGASERGPSLGRWWRGLRDRVWLDEFRAAHLRMMRDVSLIANVTASNADFYRTQGHTASIYARNLWRGPDARPQIAVPSVGPNAPVRVIGHAGRLDATGGVYGLRYLLVELLPVLERELEGIDHEVHVIGGGQLPEALRGHADHPRLVFRGFVDDLDAELRTSTAYLLLNNSGPYRAAFTRHLVAWSMGACLIVHENSRAAIPEIEDGRNVLSGRTPREIAIAVRRAIEDTDLNLRIRRGGRETFESSFTPERVVGDLAREMHAISS